METPETQRLQTILSLFSASAGITVAALRSWEKDLFNPAGENPVCRAAQKTTAGRDHCRSHCGRSVDLSLEEKETHFFKCALNLHAFSIPLKLEDGSPVVIQGGRCFLEAAEAAELSRKLEALSVPPGDISALQPVSGIRDPFTLAQSVKFLEKVLPGLFSSSGENKRMGDRLSRLTTLFSLTSDMRENPANLIPTLVNSLGLLFNLETAGVFITGDKPGPLKAAATFGRKSPVLQGLEMDLSRGLYRDLIEQGAPVTSSNTLDILRSGFPAGVSSVHLFSLFQKEGRTTGILAIIDTVLSEEDIQLIRAYCLQASTIQENHQLREERVDLAQDVSVLLEIA
ncbi:MAG TPA: PocR ligand-binding domain-containing protein, partial [Nitrospiria bacterium]|nr:PocR ligand-binding domain-containing protein [Nitrospiria bacterium]